MATKARAASLAKRQKAPRKPAVAPATGPTTGRTTGPSLVTDAVLLGREKAVREVIYRSCLALDAMDFNAYMKLCHADFRYIISAYSPELRKDMVWLDHDRNGMKNLLDVLPRHVSDNLLRRDLSRHVTVYTVDYATDGGQATVVSALQLYMTSLDGGVTELLGVAKYHDIVALDGKAPKLLTREVRLNTRMLGETGSHIPF